MQVSINKPNSIRSKRSIIWSYSLISSWILDFVVYLFCKWMMAKCTRPDQTTILFFSFFFFLKESFNLWYWCKCVLIRSTDKVFWWLNKISEDLHSVSNERKYSKLYNNSGHKLATAHTDKILRGCYYLSFCGRCWTQFLHKGFKKKIYIYIYI